MTNITAVLLVLALTGTPVASVVCVAECQGEPATSGHWHGDMTASEGLMMSAVDSCTDPSIGDSLYVIEHRAVPGPAALTTTLSPTAAELVGTVAPAILTTAADAWVKPPLVLRL